MTQVGEGISVPGVDPPDEPTDPPEEEEERVKIRISLFFDGTLNNRSNVQHRQRNSSTFQKHTKSGSYQNDLSNIARMEDHLLPASDYDHSTNFYIEGIGTDNDVGDSTRGAALGTGSTGVEAKVARGIHQIVVFVQNTLARGIIIEKLTLDSFGFSRGAAAARNFVYAIRKRLKSEYISGHKVEELDIGFVGLYDTVAAHGVIHRNDTYDLSLDAIKHARAVLQLAAADEYRDNFSLTNIDSAGGKGRQAFLPGAHSDIGGGYVDDDNENKTLCTGIAKSQSLAKMLKEQDWYNDAEMILVSEIIPTGHGAVDASSLSVRRNNIHNTYSYIPLHIMADKAVENGINIRGTLKSTYTIPRVLGSIKGELEAHAKGGAYSSPTSWQKSWPIRLYHDYLHFSGSTSLGMGVRFSGGKPLRRIYKG